MKKLYCLLLIVLMLFAFAGCGEKKILHCDNCGIEVTVDADSNMDEEWIIFCEECNNEIFGDDPILNGSFGEE